MFIRPYSQKDYEFIKTWHSDVPSAEQFSITSFVIEKDNVPAVCISVILTNTPICYMDNMVGNPEVKDRKDATQAIMNYAWNFAKDKGYKYAVGITKSDKLAERHVQMGWHNGNKVTLLGRVL